MNKNQRAIIERLSWAFGVSLERLDSSPEASPEESGPIEHLQRYIDAIDPLDPECGEHWLFKGIDSIPLVAGENTPRGLLIHRIEPVRDQRISDLWGFQGPIVRGILANTCNKIKREINAGRIRLNKTADHYNAILLALNTNPDALSLAFELSSPVITLRSLYFFDEIFDQGQEGADGNLQHCIWRSFAIELDDLEVSFGRFYLGNRSGFYVGNRLGFLLDNENVGIFSGDGKALFHKMIMIKIVSCILDVLDNPAIPTA